jgi:hypothetical protein
MKRLWVLLSLLTIVSISSFAQHSIQGKVLEKKSEGSIEMATIRLLNAKDSTLVRGCLTDLNGSFSLPKIEDGNYILDVRFLGYDRIFKDITMAGKSIILKNIYLVESDKNLKEVAVTGMTAQMTVKGDTIEYNSAAFKTAENAVVEDLLKKLPGVVVDTDGKITVNGEEIKKVRVDGKKFFGDDIQMATKNMPVDMVDKVQVIDQKSDMAKLTGFEDDNTERIINLTIKANRKKGVFGNLATGGGADKDGIFRYDANSFVNILNGEAQTAIVGGANNTNTQRSGRGRDGMSGMGNNGITETQNFGINNNTELSKNLKIGGDGTYNHTTNTSSSESEKESYLNGVTDINNSNSKSRRENNQANLRLEMEWNIDTLTTMIVQPEISHTKGISNSNNYNTYFSDGDSISWGNSTNSNDSKGLNASLRLIFSRKSKVKPGRTYTMNISGSMSNSDNKGQDYSKKTTYISATKDSISTIDQHTKSTSNGFSTDISTSFVEPLWNLKNFVELTASFRANLQKSDRQIFNDLDKDGFYSDLDEAYSNNFKNSFYNESLELNFRHQEKTYNYMLGMKAEPSQTVSTTEYKDGTNKPISNNVVNYSPAASFRYNFGRKKFARLEYRGRTSQPSINQMQPVRTNSLTNETIGNMTLNPSFEQSLRLMYSSFNSARFSSFSLGINGSYTTDALVTNSIYDETGKQYSQTVNSKKKPLSGSANIMFNTPIIKNRLQFSTRTEISYQERFGYSDKGITNPIDDNGNLVLGQLSQSKSRGGQESLNLTFTTDVVEIGLRGSVNYSGTKNNLNENKDQETTDYTGSANLNLHLPYNWTISNDMNYTTREGYSTFNHDEWVWNASIDKSVFNKKGTISLKLYDILQQKLNVRESIGDNYRELSRSNMLTTYAMISFTYRISKFGGGATNSDMFKGRRGSGSGFGGPGGPPPGIN